jgi:hypothetical protein
MVYTDPGTEGFTGGRSWRGRQKLNLKEVIRETNLHARRVGSGDPARSFWSGNGQSRDKVDPNLSRPFRPPELIIPFTQPAGLG